MQYWPFAVEVLAVHHEDAFVDRRVRLEQRRCLEAGERLAAASGVPDVAVAQILVDAFDDVLDRVDLVGSRRSARSRAAD